MIIFVDIDDTICSGDYNGDYGIMDYVYISFIPAIKINMPSQPYDEFIVNRYIPLKYVHIEYYEENNDDIESVIIPDPGEISDDYEFLDGGGKLKFTKEQEKVLDEVINELSKNISTSEQFTKYDYFQEIF